MLSSAKTNRWGIGYEVVSAMVQSKTNRMYRSLNPAFYDAAKTAIFGATFITAAEFFQPIAELFLSIERENANQFMPILAGMGAYLGLASGETSLARIAGSITAVVLPIGIVEYTLEEAGYQEKSSKTVIVDAARLVLRATEGTIAAFLTQGLARELGLKSNVAIGLYLSSITTLFCNTFPSALATMAIVGGAGAGLLRVLRA